MAYVKEEGICPVCKMKGTITRKWVLNEYGRRYEYMVFHHSGVTHYVSVGGARKKGFKKGELERILQERICSDTFKWGAFKIGDIRELLIPDYPRISVNALRNALEKLVQYGILGSVKEGRNRYFLSLSQNERLDFSMESIDLELRDIDGDGSYASHSHSGTVRNDRNWPLFYLTYRILGDEGISIADMNLQVTGCDTGERIGVVVDGDSPIEKRLLLRLREPILPGEIRKICVSYRWPESRHSFVYSAATYLNSFKLKFYGNKKVRYNVTISEPSVGKIRRITSLVKESSENAWRYTYAIKLRGLRPFTYIQFDWDL